MTLQQTLAFLTCVFLTTNLASAQTKADRKDERRENERVADAKADLQKSQRELGAAIKSYRKQSNEVKLAEDRLKSLQRDYSQAREAAEERLAESSGLPEAIRKMRGLREEIESASKPILAELHATQKWKSVAKSASDATQVRKKLLADESRTDEDLANQLTELDKLIDVPIQMEKSTVDADPKIKQLKLDYHQALDAIAELRRKIDSTTIDADPAVKACRSKVDAFEDTLSRERKSLVSLNAKVANAQSAVVGANRKLQQAQAADQKDSNKTKKSK